MPLRNLFQHQFYPTQPAIVPTVRTLECFEAAERSFHSLHTKHRIGRVLLVHGTFMGDDPLGLSETLKSLGHGLPVIGPQLERLAAMLLENTRPVATSLVDDIGNYTEDFRELFQKLVGDDPQVDFLEPTWSSQNHHLARADLAVRLIHQLLLRPCPSDQRVLLWGHSHAGNAFALLTNLLANDQTAVAAFFAAAGQQPGEHWAAVRKSLASSTTPHPLARRVSIVTFSTPVRYGWDTSGCCQIVHVTFHRPHDPEHPFLTMPLYPPHAVSDILSAKWGDWVQAFAIAGTDVSSAVSLTANEMLTKLLEANLPEPQHDVDTRFIPSKLLSDTCARWKLGTRCHSDGANYLVDYKPSGTMTPIGQSLESTMMGHGVATTLKWLPAHLSLVLEALSKQSAG